MAANSLNTVYTKIGGYTVVPVADLSLLLAPINKSGNERLGQESSGKRAGTTVLADLGAGKYALCIALGSAANSLWQSCELNTTQYTPI